MKNNFNWMAILRTGTFIDKNGQEVTIDEAKLDNIIASTDLSKEPQFVIEHPRYDKIGFGTIEKLKRVGQYLFALPKEVNEKFKILVNNGDLPGRSVTIDKITFALNNISFLPKEIPPAVTGLGDYSFSSNEFNELFFLSLPGTDSHFADLETNYFEFAQYEATTSKNNNGDKMELDLTKLSPEVRTAFEALQNEVNILKTDLNTKNVELQSATNKLSAAETENLRNEVLQFCESEEVKLKIAPADKEKFVSYLMKQKERNVIEFSAPDKTVIQFNSFDFSKELIKKLPKVIELSELATGEKANDKIPTGYQKVAKEMADSVNRKS